MKTSATAALLAQLASACAAGGPDAAPAPGEPEAAGGASRGPAEEPTPARPHAPAPPPLWFEADVAPQAEPESERCEKVDFLYVVDNSASMTNKQASLARSFAGFSRVVQETLGTVDHQIMVVDTDSRNVGDIINASHQSGPPDSCDGMLGAGQRMGAEGESCGVAGSGRFLRGDQRHAADSFACLAHVGTLGDAGERPIDALLAATGATSGEASGCNTGFLREDAILVVTLITDEEDDGSAGDPPDWKRALLRVKGGDEDAIVVLGLLGDQQVPGGLPGGPCDELSGAAAPRLEAFVESFALGSLGSVCADDYSEFFADAVSEIDTACEAFEPMLY